MEDSLAKQKESIGKQQGVKLGTGFFTLDWSAPLLPPPTPDCEPLPDNEIDPIVAAAATARKLDPALLRAVIHQESGAKPCAQSPKGAMGMMQLTQDTADRFKVSDPFDASQNIQAGAQYLSELLQRFKGDVPLAQPPTMPARKRWTAILPPSPTFRKPRTMSSES